jgi:hypothetical protein
VAADADSVVLLDGAGTPGGSESGCTHGVAWFTRRLGAQLLAVAGGYPRLPLTECLERAIGEVRSLHEDVCELDHAGSPSATVIAVRPSGAELEYLVLADSVLLVDRKAATPLVVTDDREAQVGREHRKAMDALPTGTPEHDAALRAYVETLRAYRNTDAGFWVASADPAAARHALTGTLPLDVVRAVALLSDGASRITDRFHLAEWADVLNALSEEGPSELIRRVRAAEDSDPHGRRWPRGKAKDDASAAYCIFSG